MTAVRMQYHKLQEAELHIAGCPSVKVKPAVGRTENLQACSHLPAFGASPATQYTRNAQPVTSMKILGILITAKGMPNVHAGKMRLCRCLWKTGRRCMQAAHSASPRNCMKAMEKKMTLIFAVAPCENKKA